MQRKMWRRNKQTGFHESNAVLTEKMERANDALINMAQTAMTDKDKITTLTRTMEEFTNQFGAMETKLDRILAGHTREGGGGLNTSTPTPKKYSMGPTYWKAYGK